MEKRPFVYSPLTIYYSLLCHLRSLLRLRSRMAFEGARRRKLAELVADHVLRHVDRQMASAVMHAERQPDHVRRNRRTTRPGLDGRWTRRARANALHSLRYTLIYERTFFN